MDEFALGATSVNPHDGPARNPWDLERITGGSSGGSAASVAAGLCMGAPGTDTGGSIRVPATFCGVHGLKPTLGLISRYGVLPVSWTLDTVGPITRTVRDAALFLNSVAGYDPRDLSTHRLPEQDFTAGLDDGIEHVRIGVLEEPSSTLIDAEVGEAVARAVKVLQEQGGSVDEVTIPQMARRPGYIMGPEYAAVHRETYRSSAHLPSWGRMLTEGQEFILVAWWPSIFPGLAITVVVLSTVFLGDWLRDTLDPRLRGSR